MLKRSAEGRNEMTPAEFGHRLKLCAEAKYLTASDLAVWLGRPRPTIRTWLRGTHLPLNGDVFQEVARRLQLLETDEAFPVPYWVGSRRRSAYIAEQYVEAARFSNRDIAP